MLGVEREDLKRRGKKSLLRGGAFRNDLSNMEHSGSLSDPAVLALQGHGGSERIKTYITTWRFETVYELTVLPRKYSIKAMKNRAKIHTEM